MEFLRGAARVKHLGYGFVCWYMSGLFSSIRFGDDAWRGGSYCAIRCREADDL